MTQLTREELGMLRRFVAQKWLDEQHGPNTNKRYINKLNKLQQKLTSMVANETEAPH